MERARPHLGTIVSVRVGRAPDPALAIETAFSAVARVEQLMSCHDPESELSRLNCSAHLRALPVDPWTWCVFRLAVLLGRDSAGAFDCAIGARQVAAGLLPAHDRDPPAAAEGSSADIDLSQPYRIRYRNKLYVDLGGIAKGFAVDRAVDALRLAGAESGVVNAGGDLRAYGAAAETVHVRMPGNGGLRAIGEIREAAVATSIAGEETPLSLPILDGANGRRPVARLVSLFASHCVLADALTKVVAVRGESSAPLLARYCAEALLCERDSGIWTRIGAPAC